MYTIRYTTEQFIEKSIEKYGKVYDYTLVKYVSSQTKVKIVCRKHGEFEQRPNDHLSGKGCKECGRDKFKVKKSLSLEEFIEKAWMVHGDLYDYSLVDYVHSKTKVKIICKEHGVFEQRPTRHFCGDGCPVCNSSKGELAIKLILDSKNIEYFKEYKFKDCIGKVRALPFDFYLPNHNICIEFDGKQHYEIPTRSKDQQKNLQMFIDLKENDKRKDEYCYENNIRLIRIPYTEINNIENILIF